MNRRRFIATIGAGVVAPRWAGAFGRRQDPFDFIVVGAGSSGSVVVNRLSARPDVRVLLLEAGGPAHQDPAVTTPGRWTSLIGSRWDWGYETEPEPGLGGRRITFPRGKAYGGTSAINAMTYARGHRLDFDGWAATGARGWSFDEVLPFFIRSEANSRGASSFHGAAGELAVSDTRDPHAAHLAFLDAARLRGFAAAPDWDFNGATQEGGAGFYQKNIRQGERHSAAAAFLRPILDRPNLEVRGHCHATRLLVERGRVVGVEYLQDGRRHQVRAAREVILCGGVVDTPKLLMLSGIGPADALRAHGIPVVADLAGVGKNLQDHAKVSIRWQGRTELSPSTVSAGLFTRSEQAAANTPPDLQFYLGRGLNQPERFVTITVALERPASHGEVRLRSADPLAPPVIVGNYLREEKDVNALVAGVRLARDLGRATAFDALRAEEIEPGPAANTDAELAAFVRRAVDTIYHPAATCPIGPVVSPELKVHGVEGLRIADASVMPWVVNANTHAACVMIGEKAASLIHP